MSSLPAQPLVLTVAVAAPVRRTFDYLAADAMRPERLAPGIRLSVPFGGRTRVAYLLQAGAEPGIDRARLKRVHAILDDRPLLSSADLDLLRWASRYYHHPLGEVIGTAFPVLLRQGRPAQLPGRKIVRLNEAGRQLEPADLRRAPRQATLLALLKARPDGVAVADLATLDWDWRAAARRLQERGCLEWVAALARVERADRETRPLALNSAQQQAVETLCAGLGGFSATLLEGVTGSGKTEVYMQVIEAVLGRGRQVMVLLPEIALTPQIEQRFRARFSVPIAVFHSGLTESDRLEAWLRVQRGEAAILLGTRSAAFTPMKSLGLIILDEEHDASFKQQEGFRFSARDVAVFRGRQLSIPVLLGSATPSLESLLNVERGRYCHLHLPERAGNASAPSLHRIDIRNQRLSEGLSPPLTDAIEQTLQRGEQVLLFLNRRGFAPTLICHACGWVARCPRCDANLVLHAAERHLCCHHCGHRQPALERCPACDAVALRPLGLGTERVEQVLQHRFGTARVVRVDRDRVRNRQQLEHVLASIHAGQVDIVLGTQLLAKGHHFPHVTLVGILDVDCGLFSTDFRSTERMAQLIVQVAGRAGREHKPGRVLLQTRQPGHPLLSALIDGGYRAFAADALVERRAAHLPPYCHQVLLRAEAADEALPERFLMAVRSRLEPLTAAVVEVLGPVPAPMLRRSGRYRFQLLLQSGRREPLHALLDQLETLLQRLPQGRRVRWSLDVDPVDLY